VNDGHKAGGKGAAIPKGNNVNRRRSEAERGRASVFCFARNDRQAQRRRAGDKTEGQPLWLWRHLRPVFSSTTPTTEIGAESRLKTDLKTHRNCMRKTARNKSWIYSRSITDPRLRTRLRRPLSCGAGPAYAMLRCARSSKVGLENGDHCSALRLKNARKIGLRQLLKSNAWFLKYLIGTKSKNQASQWSAHASCNPQNSDECLGINMLSYCFYISFNVFIDIYLNSYSQSHGSNDRTDGQVLFVFLQHIFGKVSW